MSQDKESESKMVFPGTFLGAEEEYLAGKNAGVDDYGNIVACTVGKKETIARNRSIEIKKPGKNALPFEPNDIILGRISLVKENSAMVEIDSAERNGMEKKILRGVAAIMIRMVDAGFVRQLSDKFRIGDIVKAKIVSVSSCGIDCSTADDREFGVIKAFCKKCRQPLQLFGMQLKCLNCGNTETRKISSDYVLK